jgi:hypothetical protein
MRFACCKAPAAKEEEAMRIDGSCHCGAISYEAEIDPEKVAICHCSDCQQLTGSAFRVTVFAGEDDFRVTAGDPTIYIKTTADSGNKRAQAFCGNCGSHLYVTGVGDGPKLYGIRTGTVRQRDQLVPKRQVWHKSALDWVDRIGELPSVERDK